MQKYNNWMISASLGDKKQTRRQSMAEMVFSWGVSELKCLYLQKTMTILKFAVLV
jgi:hypothetical protein